MSNDNRLGAALAVVAAQVSVNLGAVLGKSLFAAAGPGGAAMLRTTIAALVLVAVVRPWRAGLLRRADIGRVAIYGLALGAMNLTIYLAIARIPVGIAVTIELAGPLLVVVATTRSARDFAWLALALAGLALLAPWPGLAEPLDPVGIALAVVAAVCWASYILLGKRASHVPAPVAVAVGMCFASMVTIPVGLATAGPQLFTLPVLGAGVIIALLSSAVPFPLEMAAMRRLPSATFGMIVSCSPAIAALCGYLLLGERLSASEWLAVAAMMAASAGAAITARPASPAAGDQPTISSGLKK